MESFRVEAAYAMARRQRSLTPFEQYKLHPTQRLRNELVQANWGLVQKEARRWTHQCAEPFEDLCQEGGFGLIRAIEKFEPSSGNAFSSFAIPWIRGAIQHYLRDKGWGTVRPPRRAVETYAKVKGAKRRLIALGRELSDEEVALGLGLSPEQWRFIQKAREQPTPISLDESPIEIEAETSEIKDFSWIYEHLQA
ncbi:MAG: sigma-70 family RNA polymerase sigma factor, partial [Leptolyngbya sp. SIO1D8]|nr:sigma-70 family RNA polymerase sigma factor [Leptolyngbya sp. SIO1D8]